MPRQLFGTFQNVLLRAPEQTSPAVALPADTEEVSVSMSREDWPALGATLELYASFDNQATWELKASLQVAPFVPSIKQPTPTPAIIGWGWNSTTSQQPTHARGRIITPVNFRADVTLSRE